MRKSRTKATFDEDVQMIDGRWYLIDAEHLERCCRCHLQHYIETKVRNGRVYQRVWRLPCKRN